MTKSETNPKTEIRSAAPAGYGHWQNERILCFGNSDFGLLSDFGFWILDLPQ